MEKFYHSVTLDREKCNGCINCIKRCPTKAIRVRDEKARIIPERCVDCGVCIQVCPSHAKKAIYSPFSIVEKYKYPIALVEPSMYGQFNNLQNPSTISDALLALGFSAVFDIATASEFISDATRLLLAEGSLPKPIISSACPAITRLIRVRFPGLTENVLPLVPPMELAARMATAEALKKGIDKEDIACILLSPCPAKSTAIRMPIGYEESSIATSIAIKEVYPLLVNVMKNSPSENLPAGKIGFRWGECGGESLGLAPMRSVLAADGMENILRVLEDLEDEKYPSLEFVELSACSAGCLGGVLQVENPYIAKTKSRNFRRSMPDKTNFLENKIPYMMRWDTRLKYSPILELGTNRLESFEKYETLQSIYNQLPLLDCGSCGAPTCLSFAEDVVRGFSELDDCTVLMRRRMDAVIKAIGGNLS